MYGVKLTSKFVMESNQVEVFVAKQYKNTGGRSGTYANITTVVLRLKNGYINHDFKVVRSNWLRRATWFLTKHSSTEDYDGFIYKSDSHQILKHLQSSDIYKIPDFGWMKCSNGILTLKFYSVPDTVEQVSSYIRGMNKILQTTANNP